MLLKAKAQIIGEGQKSWGGRVHTQPSKSLSSSEQSKIYYKAFPKGSLGVGDSCHVVNCFFDTKVIGSETVKIQAYYWQVSVQY